METIRNREQKSLMSTQRKYAGEGILQCTCMEDCKGKSMPMSRT
jgi:hypothetical protein